MSESGTGKLQFWPMLKEAAQEWSHDKAARLGAALAYYSVFSLGPLLLIAIVIAGSVFGEDAARGELMAQIQGLVGKAGAETIQGLVDSTQKSRASGLAAAVGVGALIFAATGVVIQLKDALNSIWDVTPPEGKGIWGFVRDYVISIAAILGIGFLLMVSMILTTAVAAAGKYVATWLPVPEWALQAINFAVSFGVITLLFAAMFRWLPDTKVPWSDVWLGAAVTAVLFNLGKLAIGLYVGKQSFDSTYGAAGSFVVLLIWIYYSAQIVFFGAEFTQVYARRHGSRWVPQGPKAPEEKHREPPRLSPPTHPSPA